MNNEEWIVNNWCVGDGLDHPKKIINYSLLIIHYSLKKADGVINSINE